MRQGCWGRAGRTAAGAPFSVVPDYMALPGARNGRGQKENGDVSQPVARLMRNAVRGHEYWYAVESKRVNSKPQGVWQRYPGTMEDVVARCLQGSSAYDVGVYEFGAIATVWSMAERLGLERIVDRQGPKGYQKVGRRPLSASAPSRSASDCPVASLRKTTWFILLGLQRFHPEPPGVRHHRYYAVAATVLRHALALSPSLTPQGAASRSNAAQSPPPGAPLPPGAHAVGRPEPGLRKQPQLTSRDEY